MQLEHAQPVRCSLSIVCCCCCCWNSEAEAAAEGSSDGMGLCGGGFAQKQAARATT